ncbi:hypothetical protein OIO90_003982 [Microbotryomycetes sp. JL221]|nr:hypothetical protein OIO90_003982 [Microbotryomycetes sp. JL221]
MSSAPKVVITGASGLLGRATLSAFQEKGWNAKGLAFSRANGKQLVKVDLHDRQAVTNLLDEFKPQVVVHCAAERRPDVAEKDPEATHRLNVAVPAMLSQLSTDPNRPFALIYISTDYVFDGQAPPEGGYVSSSPTGPTNAYARAKLDGEREVLKAHEQDGGKVIVLRVPVLYGQVESNDESAINVLVDSVRQAAKGKQISMDDWAHRRPTNVVDVARVLVDLSGTLSLNSVQNVIACASTDETVFALSSTAKALEEQPLPPVLNFSTQQPPLTKYDISMLLIKHHNPPLPASTKDHLDRVTTGPKPGETVRPRDCHLSNKELQQVGIDTSTVDFEDWWQQWFASHPVNE